MFDFLCLGISIGEAAQKTEEVQAQLEDLISQFQNCKEKAKNISPIAVKEEPITQQLFEHEVRMFLVKWSIPCTHSVILNNNCAHCPYNTAYTP